MVTTKFIQIEVPNIGKYFIPLQFVAEDRAKYYAPTSCESEGLAANETFNEEVEFVMTDDYEGIDWLGNNMDFEDIENQIVKESSDMPSMSEDALYDTEFINIISRTFVDHNS